MSPDTELLLPAPPRWHEGPVGQRLRAIVRRLTRAYLLATGASFALFAILLLLWPPGPGAPVLPALLAAVAVVSLGAAWPAARGVPGMAAVGALAAVGGIAGSAVLLDWGLTAPAIGFLALHAALVTALASRTAGLLVTAAALATVAALAIGQAHGTVGTPQLPAPLWLAAAVHALLVVLGASGGALAARAISRFAQVAEERERRFRGLLASSADAYWELDARFRLQVLRRASGAPAGPQTSPDVIGTVPWEHPDFVCEPDALDRLQADLGARQRFREVPVGWRLPTGLRRLIVSGEPRFDARGVFLGFWGVVRDITEEALAREALAMTESRYADLFAAMPTPLVVHRDGVVFDANPAAAQMFGFPGPAAMAGADLLAFYDEGDSRERARRRMELLAGLPPGESLEVQAFQLTVRQGRRLTVRATAVGVATPRGPAVLSIYVDDTERQQAEQAVRSSEALLSHLVASSPDMITLTDLGTGRYAMVNQSFERMSGWKADEVIGRTSTEIAIWADAGERERFVQQVREKGGVQNMPFRLRRRDGRVIPILLSGARFVMDRRDYLVINARDISAQERERLERQAILDNAQIGIAMTRDQRFQWVNPAFEAMLGWPDGSIIGQPGAVVWPTAEAYAEVGQRISPTLARGEPIEIECEVQRRDGSLFLCRMLARAVDPTHPSAGGTIWIVEDITERRRMDEALARARDAAEAASRAKTAFLANTSHELRTPLHHVLELARQVRAPGTPEERRQQYLDQIVDSAQLLAQIVSDILDLSKIEAGKLTLVEEAFDLPAMLQQVHRGYLALSDRRQLALRLDASPDLGWVRGDALRVRQILTNYLSNAIKFTAAGEVRIVAARTPAGRVRLEVHDTGPGIEPAARERLFQPFSQADASTTRRHGGTGLGLSICRELARLMGGEVGVDSEPGRGSCFWAELPLPAAAPPAAPARPAAPAPEADRSLQGVHLLVVDDDAVNRMLAVAQLESFGARVGVAADGQAALDAVAAADARGDPYHLLLMDLQMPVKSGYDVARELRRRYTPQQLPIIAHTAALVSEREPALEAGMNDILPKPIPDLRQMREMVARWAAVQRGAAPPAP